MALFDEEHLKEIIFLVSRDDLADTPVSSALLGAVFLLTMAESKEHFIIESTPVKSSIELHAMRYRKYPTGKSTMLLSTRPCHRALGSYNFKIHASFSPSL